MITLRALGRLAIPLAAAGLFAVVPGLPATAQPGDAAGLLPVQRARVSLQQAIAIATERVSGRVVRADTVNREGRVVHEVLIIQDDGLVRTVRVDAETGNVL